MAFKVKCKKRNRNTKAKTTIAEMIRADIWQQTFEKSSYKKVIFVVRLFSYQDTMEIYMYRSTFGS